MNAVLNKCGSSFYTVYTNITKYTVEFSNLLNLVGIRDPDLVLLLYACLHVLL
jgi:hypothetical protein